MFIRSPHPPLQLHPPVEPTVFDSRKQIWISVAWSLAARCECCLMDTTAAGLCLRFKSRTLLLFCLLVFPCTGVSNCGHVQTMTKKDIEGLKPGTSHQMLGGRGGHLWAASLSHKLNRFSFTYFNLIEIKLMKDHSCWNQTCRINSVLYFVFLCTPAPVECGWQQLQQEKAQLECEQVKTEICGCLLLNDPRSSDIVAQVWKCSGHPAPSTWRW